MLSTCVISPISIMIKVSCDGHAAIVYTVRLHTICTCVSQERRPSGGVNESEDETLSCCKFKGVCVSDERKQVKLVQRAV